MTQEITRWLTEIRTLQQQLAAARAERDQAYKSAANWRQLYDAEAKQRRAEVTDLQATVQTLRTELSTLRAHREDAIAAVINARSSGTDVNTLEGLRAELIKALQACDRLQKALDVEKAAHAETRQTLTTALGETMDALHNEAALVPQGKGQGESSEFGVRSSETNG
jgi:predicted  nucleic acid-binding Zn-ribbon protein